ncbi:MAG: diacylglycerol kinase family protein [Candidatus Peribacteraceae bacterium]|nr:diacylglycerol kinase family protein [Candidatus Peribacteraceae bacterium]MDD5742019.1 diacylglycerol kinase family protein [Candidatus Peribacteraceae bacterium]
MVHVFAKSAANALRGISFVWQRERNFRILFLVGILVIASVIALGFTYMEVVSILVSVSVVLGAELFNTVVEELLDVVEPHYSVHVGRIKDVTAGVVLLLSLFAGLIGIATVIHHYTFVLR